MSDVHSADQPDLPGPRCNEYVSGGGFASSFPCRLFQGHPGSTEGFHVAVEIPISQVRYDAWVASKVAAASAQPKVQAPVARHGFTVSDGGATITGSTVASSFSSGLPHLNVEALHDPKGREDAQLARLKVDSLGHLPDRIRTAMMGDAALVSVTLLWQFCQQAFASGAREVAITQEFLDRLLTPTVKEFVISFLIDQPSTTP